MIDEHPAGWSTLGADLAQAPDQLAQQLDRHCGSTSACYCHDQRPEQAGRLIVDTDRPRIADWAYVLRPRGLEVICLDTLPPRGSGPVLPWTTDPQPTSGKGRSRFRSLAFKRWQPGQNPPEPAPVAVPARPSVVVETARRRR